jgi:hypothetical protein
MTLSVADARAEGESCPTPKDEIATDRPDVTNSSLVVPFGSFQSENGINTYSRDACPPTHASKASCLTSRSRNARDKTVEGIARRHNDGHYICRFFGRTQPLIARDNHHLHTEPDELAR